MMTLLLAVIIILLLPLILEVSIVMLPYVVISAVVVFCVVCWPVGVTLGLLAIAGHVAGLKRVKEVIENERFKSAARIVFALLLAYIMIYKKL